MSPYEWPLSPVYEIPSSSSFSFDFSEPISEIPEYDSSSPSSSSLCLNFGYETLCKSRSTIPNLLSYLRTDKMEPQITTSPKHRLRRMKSLITLRRTLPSFTIFLIILTFTYLTIRDEPLASGVGGMIQRVEGARWRGYGYEYTYNYEKRDLDSGVESADGLVFEELGGSGVPTGFAE